MVSKCDKKIFIIDDDECIVALEEKILNAQGYEVMATTDPDYFLEQIKIFSPHLVLVDLEMPKKSGIDIIYEIKFCRISSKILVVSGTKNPGLERLARVHSDGFFRKPINQLDFVTKIENILF